MFYVSGITGTLTPFDPRTTPLSEVAQPILPIPAASSVTEVTIVDIPGVQTAQIQAEDAAVYEGHVRPSSVDVSGAKEALNIARAAAAMTYRIHEAEHSEESRIPEEIGPVKSIHQTRGVEDDDQTPHRVNPIKRSRYQSQMPAKERKKVVNALDIMSSPVLTLHENSPVEEARRIFKEHRFRHIPIVSSGGKMVGIVSDRDFLGVVPQNVSITDPIKAHMVINILVARPLTEIPAIAEVMINHRIGCLPILDENDCLVGILTRSDILRAIVNHAPIELWT